MMHLLIRVLPDPSDQSLRDPLWTFQLGEMADTRHNFQGKAIGEGFRAYHIPGDLGNAAVHVAADAQCRHLDNSTKKPAESERGGVQAEDAVAVVAECPLQDTGGLERFFSRCQAVLVILPGGAPGSIQQIEKLKIVAPYHPVGQPLQLEK